MFYIAKSMPTSGPPSVRFSLCVACRELAIRLRSLPVNHAIIENAFFDIPIVESENKTQRWDIVYKFKSRSGAGKREALFSLLRENLR